ncbi:SUKH-4 family immunity protein [Streptomyces sp. NPDC005055]
MFTRSDPTVVAGWRISGEQKALLVRVGVPIVDQLIEYVAFQTEAEPALQASSGTSPYRLTQNHHGDLMPGLRWSFGLEPGTGHRAPGTGHRAPGTGHRAPGTGHRAPGRSTTSYLKARPANSSIDPWLRTLHHYGLHISASDILSNPGEHETRLLAELSLLADKLKEDRSTRPRGLHRIHLGQVPRTLFW